ncbi:hypothetical protein HK096_000039, partial [Nowakowskiella sp. JEL0078]
MVEVRTTPSPAFKAHYPSFASHFDEWLAFDSRRWFPLEISAPSTCIVTHLDAMRRSNQSQTYAFTKQSHRVPASHNTDASARSQAVGNDIAEIQRAIRVVTDGFWVGRKIEVVDPANTWWAASMVALDTATGNVRVRYDDWGVEYDEWLTLASRRWRPQLDTVKPSGFRKRELSLDKNLVDNVKRLPWEKSVVLPLLDLTGCDLVAIYCVGRKVEIFYVPGKTWYPGLVVSVNHDAGKVLVRYLGWDDSHNE